MPECPLCSERAEARDRFCRKCGAELPDRPAEMSCGETAPVMSVAEVCRRLGSVYYRRGNRREALEAWTRSLELEPEHPNTRTWVEKVRAEFSEP